MPYKDVKDLYILGDVSELIAALDESLVTVNTVLGSRYVGGIRDFVEGWRKNLILFQDTLDEWLACQRADSASVTSRSRRWQFRDAVVRRRRVDVPRDDLRECGHHPPITGRREEVSKCRQVLEGHHEGHGRRPHGPEVVHG